MDRTGWKRKICWPNPDATCLEGGCAYCETQPFVFESSIARYARQHPAVIQRGTGRLVASKRACAYGARNPNVVWKQIWAKIETER